MLLFPCTSDQERLLHLLIREEVEKTNITLLERFQKQISHYWNGSKNKYHTFGTVPKSNRKIVERGKIDTPNTYIHYRSLCWFGTVTSITKSGGDKLA